MTALAADAAVGTLGVEVPALPADNAAQGDLVLALTGLSTEIEAATTKDACAGVPAPALGGLSAVGASTAYASDLPQAIREMAAAGYPVPLALPAMPARYNRRLGNGELIVDTAAGGLGDLGITGSYSSDAVVELVCGGRPVIEVYVRENGSPDVHGIPDGRYDVYVETGADWDSSARSFTRGCQSQKFDSPLDFATTATSSTLYTISVGAVIDGNTSVTPVDGLPR